MYVSYRSLWIVKRSYGRGEIFDVQDLIFIRRENFGKKRLEIQPFVRSVF